MENTHQNNEQSKFYRFQVFLGETDFSGRVAKSKSVGMAYLKEGQNIYTLRLWTFLLERYYLLQNNSDASKYFIMTREPNKNPGARSRYFWNIVGNGTVDTTLGLIALHFDLFPKTIYLNIYPEASAHSSSLAAPEELAA